MICAVFDVPERDRELLIAELWEMGTAGITEEPDRLLAFFEPGRDLSDLIVRWAACHPRIEAAAERDWAQKVRDEWQSIPVGERFFLVPEWRDDPVPPGRVRLTTHPGMACGTGLHPATQLSLIAMEKWVKPGDCVADVGTGTGILAAAAALLGARFIAACDIGHQSAEIAKRNLHETNAAVFTGSARSLRTGAFDAVVANLNAATLLNLGPELKRLCRPPDGLLILSGFRGAEQAGVITRTGFGLVDEQYDNEWACIVLGSAE